METPAPKISANIAESLTASASSPNSTSIAGWDRISELVYRRTLVSALLSPMPETAASDLGLLCLNADFAAYQNIGINELLFFDLETTGLSTGAGTLAFLAAFGRIVIGGALCGLKIHQYLLLDYPGEAEFLLAVRRELESSPTPPILVSYNGRVFDSQLLRTRMIMNGSPPIHLRHLDLLYPVRRLYRKALPACSQLVVERMVLGINRTDDLPGSEAPEAWFSFLKTKDGTRLQAVADHNRRDLEGLVALFRHMDTIARDPVAAGSWPLIDVESLALRWHRYRTVAVDGVVKHDRIREGQRLSLLRAAADASSYKANAILAREAERRGAFTEAFDCWRKAADLALPVDEKNALRTVAAYRALSQLAACRFGEWDSALRWAESALDIPFLPSTVKAVALRRIDRLRALRQRAADRGGTGAGKPR